MKKVLVDLNVLLDFLAKRDKHKDAALIVSLCEEQKIIGFLAAHEITTLAYFLTKTYKNKISSSSIINSLLDIFSTISVSEKILRDALNSNISDFEDAVIEQSALKEKLDYIITNNISDFKKSKVKAITPGEYLTLMNI